MQMQSLQLGPHCMLVPLEHAWDRTPFKACWDSRHFKQRPQNGASAAYALQIPRSAAGGVARRCGMTIANSR